MTASAGIRRRPLGSTPPDRQPIRRIDWSVVVLVTILSGVGVAAIYSATQRALREAGDDPAFYAQRQVVFIAIGMAAAVIVWSVDYRSIGNYVGQIYVVTVLALVGVLAVGVEVNGARSWYQFPGFQLQPSEFAKLALILVLAAFLTAQGPGMPLLAFVSGLTIAGVPTVLVLAQPDIGTVLVYVAIVMGTFLLAGVRARHIVGASVLAVVGVAAILGLGLLPEPQEARITAFIDNDAPAEYRYNAEQSEIAIGAGGLRGRGWLQGTQTNLDFVPEQHTDFIFTAIAEEFGFIGAGAVLVAYGFLILRLWRIAMVARDPFGTVIVGGVLSMILFMVFQNVGMAIGIMPITGIPLPFLSHGGSSIIMMWAAIGLVQNVNSRRFT